MQNLPTFYRLSCLKYFLTKKVEKTTLQALKKPPRGFAENDAQYAIRQAAEVRMTQEATRRELGARDWLEALLRWLAGSKKFEI